MQFFLFLLLALWISPLLSVKKHLRSSDSCYRSTKYLIQDTTTKLFLRVSGGSAIFSGDMVGSADYYCFSPTGIIKNNFSGKVLYHHTEKVNGVLTHKIGFDDHSGYTNYDYQWSIVRDYTRQIGLYSVYERVFFTYNDGDVSETVCLGATPTKIASGNWRDCPVFHFFDYAVGVK